MPVAVGVIETLGFPAILAAADAMVKGGRVTLVYFDKAEKGNFYVAIRGPVSEVERGMADGMAAVKDVFGGEVMSHYIVPNPPENIVQILALAYTDEVEEFRV